MHVFLNFLVNYRRIGMLADPFFKPKAQVFDELGMRVKNQLFLQMGITCNKRFAAWSPVEVHIVLCHLSFTSNSFVCSPLRWAMVACPHHPTVESPR